MTDSLTKDTLKDFFTRVSVVTHLARRTAPPGRDTPVGVFSPNRDGRNRYVSSARYYTRHGRLTSMSAVEPGPVDAGRARELGSRQPIAMAWRRPSSTPGRVPLVPSGSSQNSITPLA